MCANDLVAMMTRKETLHPELVPYVQTLSDSSQFLNAPLVQQLFLDTERCALVNECYRQKQQALAEAVAAGKWQNAIFIHERPYRVQALYDLRSKLTDVDYWKLVLNTWTDSENIWQNKTIWRRLWSRKRPYRESAMSLEDNRIFNALPQTVWRGGNGAFDWYGLSWTTDKATALRFAQRWGKPGDGLLLAGSLEGARVFAYTNARSESEVIADRVRVLSHTHV